LTIGRPLPKFFGLREAVGVPGDDARKQQRQLGEVAPVEREALDGALRDDLADHGVLRLQDRRDADDLDALGDAELHLDVEARDLAGLELDRLRLVGLEARPPSP
jgi:hypothetical protein